MNSSDWLKLARDKEIQKRISNDSLIPLYGSVVRQFADWKTVTWDNAVVALHIVYCWMPTMPDLGRPATTTEAEQAKIVLLLNQARIRTLTETEIDELKENLVNNSVVGTSKLLHLLAPEKYAIWDSRVAKVWYAPESLARSHYRESKEYLAYNFSLTSWLTDKQVVEEIVKIKRLSSYLDAASNLRILELVLFHAK